MMCDEGNSAAHGRRTRWLHLLLPVAPLAGWYAYHYLKTGFLLGNPEFFRYNVAATLNPLRIPLAFGMRLWQLFGYFGLYLLTLAGLLAMLRPPLTVGRVTGQVARPRIPFWVQAAFLSVAFAYLAFMSVAGGAVLARYMLPVIPLVILVMVSTLWRRARYWKLIAVAVAIAFVAGLFTNPPYGFSLEDNLAYRDYVVLHAEASRFLAMRYPGARVLTAWPASDELTRPWLGYVSAGQHFRVVRVEDFSAPQVDVAAALPGQFDLALVCFHQVSAAASPAWQLGCLATREAKVFRLSSRFAARRHCPTSGRNHCFSQRRVRSVGGCDRDRGWFG